MCVVLALISSYSRPSSTPIRALVLIHRMHPEVTAGLISLARHTQLHSIIALPHIVSHTLSHYSVTEAHAATGVVPTAICTCSSLAYPVPHPAIVLPNFLACFIMCISTPLFDNNVYSATNITKLLPVANYVGGAEYCASRR